MLVIQVHWLEVLAQAGRIFASDGRRATGLRLRAIIIGSSIAVFRVRCYTSC